MLFRRRTCANLPMREAAALLAKDGDIRLLDVRTDEEYKEGHLPGSLHLPLNRLAGIARLVPDQNVRLFVYCHSGARSQAACEQLSALGYTDVTNIGGVIHWAGPLQVSAGG